MPLGLVMASLLLHKLLQVQGLDAALRAMQNAAVAQASEVDKCTQPDQQQKRDSQQQQKGQDAQQQPSLSPLLAAGLAPSSAGSGVGSSTGQQQQRSPGSVSSSPAQLTAEHSGMSASAAAERLQQQAQQLSDLLARREAMPAAAAARDESQPADEKASATPSSPQQLASAATAAPSRRSAADVLPSMAPLVLSPHFPGVSEALQDLAAWQLQQGLITHGQAVSTAVEAGQALQQSTDGPGYLLRETTARLQAWLQHLLHSSGRLFAYKRVLLTVSQRLMSNCLLCCVPLARLTSCGIKCCSLTPLLAAMALLSYRSLPACRQWAATLQAPAPLQLLLQRQRLLGCSLLPSP
jgi:hypothetical protein